MPPRRFIFDSPDRFVAEATGEPGKRAFFLQATEGRRVVTVALEKAQVAVLAERLGELLAEVEHRGVTLPTGVNPSRGGLDEPIIEAFRVGTMTLTWDGNSEAVVVEAREVMDDDADSDTDDDDEDEDAGSAFEDGPDLLRVQLSAPAVRGFIVHANRVVAAGRLPCPLCGQPLNPEGHICPRKNGYMH